MGTLFRGLLKNIGPLLMEGQRSPSAWAEALDAAGKRLAAQYARLPDGDFNRRVLNHVIGIERWGQRRLKVALGEPFVTEEYDGYRPPRETGWTDLQALFAETRAATVALARQLDDKADVKILHNGWGELTVRGWLNYLHVHASLESRKMK